MTATAETSFLRLRLGTRPCPHPILRFLTICYFRKILSVNSFSNSRGNIQVSYTRYQVVLYLWQIKPVLKHSTWTCIWNTVNCRNIKTRVVAQGLKRLDLRELTMSPSIIFWKRFEYNFLWTVCKKEFLRPNYRSLLPW